MAAPARTSLIALPKDHRFPATALQLTKADAGRYLAAVEDGNAVYLDHGLAPPLAIAARALGALLEAIELPDGTLHTGQEIETRAALPLDAPLTMRGRVAQRSERAGMVICVLELEVSLEGEDEPALVGRTTVLAPGGGSG
jgi:hypothetical protein